MISRIAITTLLIITLPSVVFAFSASYCGKIQERVERELSSLQSSNAALMGEDKIENIDKMILNANTASRLADELKDACDKASAFGDYQGWCYGYFQIHASESADMKLKVADYCLKKKLPERAKQLYREIITTYTGDAYGGYVKQAEFGLEDVRSLEKKMEQEKEEKERVGREAKEREEGSSRKTSKKKQKK